jgi:hypothetical protein
VTDPALRVSDEEFAEGLRSLEQEEVRWAVRWVRLLLGWPPLY